eukprot:SAG25_NODE_731_length_5686_cov_14.271523_6_plen_123_part_00
MTSTQGLETAPWKTVASTGLPLTSSRQAVLHCVTTDVPYKHHVSIYPRLRLTFTLDPPAAPPPALALTASAVVLPPLLLLLRLGGGLPGQRLELAQLGQALEVALLTRRARTALGTATQSRA